MAELKTKGISQEDDSNITSQYTDFYGYGTEQEKLDANVAVRNITNRFYVSDTFRTSSGTQVITGVGFTPKVINFIATDGSKSSSDGVYREGGFNKCVYLAPTSSYQTQIHNTVSIRVDDNSGNSLAGYVSAVSSDGFTITWVLSGTKTCYFIYECFG